VIKCAAASTGNRRWLKTWGSAYGYGAEDANAIVLGARGTLYVACEGQSTSGVQEGVPAKYSR
jgi:hypothetical protein